MGAALKTNWGYADTSDMHFDLHSRRNYDRAKYTLPIEGVKSKSGNQQVPKKEKPTIDQKNSHRAKYDWVWFTLGGGLVCSILVIAVKFKK